MFTIVWIFFTFFPHNLWKIENVYFIMEFFYFCLDKPAFLFYNDVMKQTTQKKQKNIFYKYISNDMFEDFQVIAIGKEKCLANKKQEGPFIKNRFVIHYVTNGKGFYNINGKLYTLQAGDIFFIPATQIIFYYPDPQDPWEYFWFEYNGHHALALNERAGLNAQAPVYKVKNPDKLTFICNAMLENLNDQTDDLTTVSFLYRVFAEIINERALQKAPAANSRDDFIGKIFTYISSNYSSPALSLTDIAAHFNINASYLSRIFRQTAGVPISKYIIDFRMSKAVNLLKRRDLSIKHVAISVGYSDPLYFSREFSRLYRISPSSYRKEVEQEEEKSHKKKKS